MDTIRTVQPLSADPAFCEAFAQEAMAIEGRTYIVADAYTHAPITPYAPMPGRIGISADTARALPGMTALRVDDVDPAARARFARHLDASAHLEFRTWEIMCERWDEYHASGNQVAADNVRKRANRAADESDRLSDRAFAVRRTIAHLLDDNGTMLPADGVTW